GSNVTAKEAYFDPSARRWRNLPSMAFGLLAEINIGLPSTLDGASDYVPSCPCSRLTWANQARVPDDRLTWSAFTNAGPRPPASSIHSRVIRYQAPSARLLLRRREILPYPGDLTGPGSRLDQSKCARMPSCRFRIALPSRLRLQPAY